jgi:hypothetical protein
VLFLGEAGFLGALSSGGVERSRVDEGGASGGRSRRGGRGSAIGAAACCKSRVHQEEAARCKLRAHKEEAARKE